MGGDRPTTGWAKGNPPRALVAAVIGMEIFAGCQGQAAVLHLQVLHAQGITGRGG